MTSNVRLSTCLFAALLLVGCATSPPPAPTVEAQSEEPAVPLKNSIRWATASEVDNFGFDVFRGDAEEGPFTRLNEEPIAGAGTTDEPQRYLFVDETIEAGRSYWYYVESIAMDGSREKFTPTFKSKPKP